MSTPRLYFITRNDLSEGKRAAQLLHAMDQWCARFGPQQGTVIVYSVPNEAALLEHLPLEGEGRTALWREPDMDDQATAIATDQGPLNLPLLGRRKASYPLEAVA